MFLNVAPAATFGGRMVRESVRNRSSRETLVVAVIARELVVPLDSAK
jgi:hypothetical protein